MGLVIILVVYVPNIKEVFGLAGATVATMLVIVMPAGFYYQVIFSQIFSWAIIDATSVFVLLSNFSEFTKSDFML